MPKYSIITLTYGDRFKPLRRCIETVYACSKNHDFEYLCVDNNASEQTKKVIRDYAQLPEFTWIHRETNEGVSARNYAIEMAKGEFFIVVDDDVIILTPDWITTMESQMADDVWATGPAGSFYNPKGECGFFENKFAKTGDYADFITGFCVMYRNIRKLDGSPLYLFDRKLRSLRDESDFTNCAKLDGWRLRQCSDKICQHASYRRWDPNFDSIDGDSKYFMDKWLPIKDKIKWEKQ